MTCLVPFASSHFYYFILFSHFSLSSQFFAVVFVVISLVFSPLALTNKIHYGFCLLFFQLFNYLLLACYLFFPLFLSLSLSLCLRLSKPSITLYNFLKHQLSCYLNGSHAIYPSLSLTHWTINCLIYLRQLMFIFKRFMRFISLDFLPFVEP